MQLVTLKNKTGQAVPIVLDHAAFRNRASGFRRRSQTVIDHNGKTGAYSRRTISREEPGSITLPARGEVCDLHPAIKNCAQVRNLLSRGIVEIVPQAVASVTGETPVRRSKKGAV